MILTGIAVDRCVWSFSKCRFNLSLRRLGNELVLLGEREAVGQVLDAKLHELLKRLRECPRVAALKLPLAPQSPVLPIVFRHGNQRFSYCSLITTVGTPQCITAQELCVECMSPMEFEGR